MSIFIQTDNTGAITAVQRPFEDQVPTAGWHGDTLLVDVSSSTLTDWELLEDYYWDEDSSSLVAYPTARPSSLHVWTASKQWERNDTAFMAEVRASRTIRLQKSDWTQMSDSPLTPEQKSAWATYRQELRDITANLTGEETSAGDVSWPTQPTN